MSLSRTRITAAGAILLVLAGCNTDPAGVQPDTAASPPSQPRAEVVERISHAEHPPQGTEATLGGVGSLRVCLVDADGEPTDDCMTVAALDEDEWDRYRVGDEYPVEGTFLDPEGER